MEAPMGKTFASFSTDPATRRRLREAHAARNSFMCALFTGMFAGCRALLMRVHREDVAAGGCVAEATSGKKYDGPM
jgi:hypothetical protein